MSSGNYHMRRSATQPQSLQYDRALVPALRANTVIEDEGPDEGPDEYSVNVDEMPRPTAERDANGYRTHTSGQRSGDHMRSEEAYEIAIQRLMKMGWMQFQHAKRIEEHAKKVERKSDYYLDEWQKEIRERAILSLKNKALFEENETLLKENKTLIKNNKTLFEENEILLEEKQVFHLMYERLKRRQEESKRSTSHETASRSSRETYSHSGSRRL